MSARLESVRREAETLRLARLLNCPPEDLGFLAPLTAAELRLLRRACQTTLDQDHHPVLLRSLSASNLLPSALVASIGEHTLGPLLCARACMSMSVPRITSLCRHASPPFLARVCQHMDPDKLAEITYALPLPLVNAVVRELMAHRQFIVLGEVVELVPREALQPLLADLHDGEALLRTCFFIDHPARLHMLLELLSPAQLRELVAAAADPSQDLLPLAVALLTKIFPIWQRRLVGVAAECPEPVLECLLAGVARHDLWQRALPMLGHLPGASLRRIMALEGWTRPEILEPLLAQASQPTLRVLVEQLAGMMPAPARKELAEGLPPT